VKADLAASADAAHAKSQRTRLVRVGLAIVGFAIVVAIVNYFSGGAFLTPGNLTNVLRQITYNAILAVGQTRSSQIPSRCKARGSSSRRSSSGSRSDARRASSTRCPWCGSACRRSSRPLR
jgi:hypothetical protein